MNILSLAPTSFFNDYGCHVRILEEARALQARGHRVTVVTYFKGSDVPDVEIIRTRPTPWRSQYEVGSSRHKFVFDVLLGARLLRVLGRRKFDIIHAHLHEGALIAGVLARPWRVPVVFDFQGSLTDEMLQHRFIQANTLPHRTFRQIERLIDRLPHAIVTSTRNAADTLRQELGPRRIIKALPDGVNTNTVRPGLLSSQDRRDLRAQFGIGPDEVVVAFLGLLAQHQGIQCIIDAAAQLKAQGKAVRWLVMGYPDVARWRAAATAVGVQADVLFPGRVPYGYMPQMLAMGDIAVAPKLSLTEGSGKILNYMAMGLPTVAFDTPAQREILGALGVYAPIGDVDTLASKVAELVDQPVRRRALGEQLRMAAVQHHSWDRAAETMVSIYERLISQRAGRIRQTGAPRSAANSSHSPHDKTVS